MIARRVERAVPPLGTFIEVDGERIHYVEAGAGAPVVMIHGLGAVLQSFTYALVDRLAPRCRAIAMDRPGAGYSSRSPGRTASLREQAATIARFIDMLGLERPLIVGHSLGGMIALALALDHPEIPRALALISPQTQAERLAPRPFKGLQIESALLRKFVANTIAVPMGMINGAAIVAKIFAPEPVPPDFGTRGGGLLGLRPRQFYNTSSDMMAARDDVPAIVERYAELHLPIHVLFGTQDAVLDYHRHAQAFAHDVAGVDLSLVPGGHMLPITQPDAVAAWLERFI